jgi:polysaccharide export outer membrane protein
MRSTIVLKLIILTMASLLVGAAAAQQSPQKSVLPSSAETARTPDADTPQHPFSQRFPRYELRAGDVFDLTFEFSPEFNQTVAVQPDGFVTLREIGDIHVAGQTVPELTSTIKTAYSKILNDPVISLVLKDFEKPYFIASGEVTHPGKYELRGDTTITEAIAIAGGFNDAAKHSQVVVYRRVSRDWMEGRVVNVKKMWGARNLSEDALLNPGDMVFVPRSQYSKFRRFIPAPGLGIGLGGVPAW